MVRAYINIGDCYAADNKLDTAIVYYQHGLASSLSSFSDIQNIFANPTLANSIPSRHLFAVLTKKARAFNDKYTQTNDAIWLKESIKVCKVAENFKQKLINSLSYQDQIRHTDDMITLYELGVDACYKLYEITNEDQYKEGVLFFSEKKKANTLSSILSSVKAKKMSGIPEQLLEKEKQLSLELTYYNTEIQKHREASPFNHDSLIAPYFDSLFEYTQQYAVFMHRLEEDYPRYFQLKHDPIVVTSRELQSYLEDSTVIISYTIDDNQIIIITLSDVDFEVHRVPIDYEVFNLEKTIYSLQSVIQKKSLVQRRFRDKYIFNSHLLYQYLIEPVLDEIKGQKRLIIIPEGKLHYLSFDALLSSTEETNFQKMPYLIRDYTITNHYSMTLYTDFTQKPLHKRGDDLLAIAPIFDEEDASAVLVSRQNGPLIWSEREVKFIQDLYQQRGFKSTVLLRAMAQEDTFKLLVNQMNYKTIHLSSHGLANPIQPDLSWVAFSQSGRKNRGLSDGFLRASEIYNLELKTNLLVLSSCESGIGQLARGEGMISINRGFLYAGALNVVYSIWKINDRYTYELMKGFYSHLDDDYSYADALRESKIDMINKNKIAAMPSNWAGFLILGQ